jgi:SET domain-containing protein
MNRHLQEKKEKELLKKENLLNNIRNETFCKLGVSDISGIGVIAIKDIPKRTEIFNCCNNDGLGMPIEIKESDLEDVDEPVLKYAKNFLVQSAPNTYPFPFMGLNSINIIFYLNHSDNPNTEFSFSSGLDDFVSFVTSEEVKKGEELTQDYNNLSNNKEELIKQFPFLRQQKVKL